MNFGVAAAFATDELALGCHLIATRILRTICRVERYKLKSAFPAVSDTLMGFTDELCLLY